MTATPELEEEWKILIRSALISDPIVKRASTLQRELEREEGAFPYRVLGYPSFVDYLRSIPSVVRLIPENSPNPEVHPVVTKASSHIDKLVSKQRTVPKKTRSLSRRGGYNGGFYRPPCGPPVPRRRPPPRYYEPPQSRPRPTPLFSSPPLNKGIHVRDLENQFLGDYRREDLTRNGISNGRDLLDHASDMVVQVADKVYLKMQPQADYNTRNSVNHAALPAPAGIAEDLDDDYDDFDDDDSWDSEEKLSTYTIEHFSRAVSESNKLDDQQQRKEEDERANIEEKYHDEHNDISDAMIKNFRKILEKYPDGVWSTELPQKYFDEFKVKLDLQDLGFNSAISLANTLPRVFTYERAGEHDWKLYDARSVKHVESSPQENVSGLCDDNEKYIPSTIIDNIKKLVKIYPDGFRSTSLESLYEKQFNKSLNLTLLGFNNLEDFVGVLKTVVTVLKAKDYSILLPKHVQVPREAVTPQKPEEVLRLPEEYYQLMAPDDVLKLNDDIPYQELPPLKLDGKPHEPLLEIDVRISEVTSPSLFYLFFDSKYQDLQDMMDDLHKFYELEKDNYHIPLPLLAVNLLCACKYEDYWHRARITAILKNNKIKIEYIDYGTPESVERTKLRFLHKQFAEMPLQGICAKLHGIKPVNNEKLWPAEAKTEFFNIIREKKFFAQVYHVDYHQRKNQIQLGVLLFHLKGKEPMEVNEYLVKKGFATYEQANDVAEDRLLSVIQDGASAAGNSVSEQQPKRPRTPPGFKTKDQLTPPLNFEDLLSGFSDNLNNYLSSYQPPPPLPQLPLLPQPPLSKPPPLPQPPLSKPPLSKPPLLPQPPHIPQSSFMNNYPPYYQSQNNDLLAMVQQSNFMQNQNFF